MPAPVPLLWADIDHGIKFDPSLRALLRVEIDAPEVFLPGSLLEQHLLSICMQVPADRHDLLLYVNDSFDESSVTEDVFFQLPPWERGANNKEGGHRQRILSPGYASRNAVQMWQDEFTHGSISIALNDPLSIPGSCPNSTSRVSSALP